MSNIIRMAQPTHSIRNTGKTELVNGLLEAKRKSRKTFTQISEEIGLTNAYTAQLFYNQAQLKASTAPKLREAVPALTIEQVELMQLCPTRSYDESILQEPHVYRMHEAVMHYGEAIKAIMNEEVGDGIMSAIDMYFNVKVIEGKAGEKRICLIMNGKFLPHVEQRTEDNTAPS